MAMFSSNLGLVALDELVQVLQGVVVVLWWHRLKSCTQHMRQEHRGWHQKTFSPIWTSSAAVHPTLSVLHAKINLHQGFQSIFITPKGSTIAKHTRNKNDRKAYNYTKLQFARYMTDFKNTITGRLYKKFVMKCHQSSYHNQCRAVFLWLIMYN